MAVVAAPPAGAPTVGPYEPTEAEEAAVRLFEVHNLKDEPPHLTRCRTWEQRWQTFLGALDPEKGQKREGVENWQSDLHPPYAMQIVETLYSMLTDEHPKSRVLPTSRNDVEGAKRHEKLLEVQRKKDRFDEKQPDWIKQAIIFGGSPMKIHYAYDRRKCKRWAPKQAFFGGTKLVEEEYYKTFLEQPVTTVVPVEDFWWDVGARTPDEWSRVYHRVWMTTNKVRRFGEPGPNGEPARWRNTEHVSGGVGTPGPGKSFLGDLDLSERNEIIEMWVAPNRQLTIANRQVILEDREWPYWHGHFPFVYGTTMRNLRSVEGLSEVEVMRETQAVLWSFLNQRIDNATFMNQAVMLIEDSFDDPQKVANAFKPGGAIPVSNPGQIQMWSPPQQIIQASLAAESAAKEELQNLTGAVAYLSGAAEGTIDQKTATGITAIQSLAQRRMIAKRNLFYQQLRRVGQQQIALNQQFITRPMMLRIDETDEFDFFQVLPEDVAGDYDFDVENSEESLNRQQVRTEALNLFSVAAAQMPAFQMTGQVPNLRVLFDAVLEAHGKKMTEEFWLTPAVPPLQPPPNPAAPWTGGGVAPPTLNGAVPAGAPAPSIPAGPQQNGTPPALMAPSGG